MNHKVNKTKFSTSENNMFLPMPDLNKVIKEKKIPVINIIGEKKNVSKIRFSASIAELISTLEYDRKINKKNTNVHI